MNEQPPTATRDLFAQLRGIWIVFAGIALSFAPRFVAMHIDPGAQIGIDPPWYFIIMDFYVGIGALIGATLSIALSIAMWKRFPLFSHMNLWMTILWQIQHIALAVYIWIQCTNMFDRAHAVCPWNRFDEYLRNPIKSWPGLLFMAVAFLIAMFPPGRKKRRSAAENPADGDPLIPG